VADVERLERAMEAVAVALALIGRRLAPLCLL